MKVSVCLDFGGDMRCRTMRTWYALMIERELQVYRDAYIDDE
jgi:hypothetical protein